MEKTVYDRLNVFMPGIKNLDPCKLERKSIFLKDDSKSRQKGEMLVQLECFEEIIDKAIMVVGNHDNDIHDVYDDLIKECDNQYNIVEKTLRENVSRLLHSILILERSYRDMNLFFENTEMTKLPNITIVNTDLTELVNPDKSQLFDLVKLELQQNYDRLDLRSNYSLFVIGGYLGGNSNLDRWLKVAYENKVMICTDFANIKDPMDMVEIYESQNHAGGELYRSNCIMCCNWIVSRHGDSKNNIPPLYLSPAMALAGNLYRSVLSQPSAGKKYGAINGANDVVFPLKKSEVSYIESIGLVPIVKEFGRVMAFSARTLFNGSNPGLQVYSVVRVFDYITKVLIDFLNRRAFENWNSSAEIELRQQIVKFLDSIQGPERLIEKFKIIRFEKSSGEKDKILLDINITPYFPAKSFLIKLDGMKDDDETKWISDYKS